MPLPSTWDWPPDLPSPRRIGLNYPLYPAILQLELVTRVMTDETCADDDVAGGKVEAALDAVHVLNTRFLLGRHPTAETSARTAKARRALQ